jgi:ribosomal subunit interface protein
MDIRVSGRQVDVGDAFKARAALRLNGIAEKYFSRALSASVTLSREAHGHGFHVDCAMHVRQGILLKAEGNAGDANFAFDEAAEHIEKQLRRHKRRLKSHSNGALRGFDASAAAAYVIRDLPVLEPAFEDVGDAADCAAEAPVIIAETTLEVPTASVSDAVMLMDLQQAPALMFRNAKSGALNMIYRRKDGHIGWVDPGVTK